MNMKRYPSVFARSFVRSSVPVAVAAALVFSACGSDDSASDSTLPTADSELVAPRPIQLAGAGSPSGAAPAAAESADGRVVATDMMAPYRIVTFVAGPDLPALPTNDIGYVFQADASEVSAERVAELAAALGVVGEPVFTDDGYNGWWRVGPEDGTAPMLQVSGDAQLNWYYSGAWDQTVRSGCAVAEPAVAVAVEGGSAGDVPPATIPVTVPPAPDECVEPEPPVGVPTLDEAAQKATELLTAVGLDPATFTLDSNGSYADEWFASVTMTEKLDGAFAGRMFSAGFGAEGALQFASGQLAVPAPAGPYPLIDLDAALARLNDPSGFYGGFYGGRGVGDIAVMSDAAVEPALGAPTDVAPTDIAIAETVPAGGGSEGSEGSAVAPPSTDVVEIPIGTVPGEVPIGTVPGEMPVPGSVPAPEQVTVTLVDVQADVWWAWDADGSVWLLPAYRFIGDDGGWYTVPAVTDEFLVQAPPTSIEPLPVPEPLPVETVTPGVPSPVPAEPAQFDPAALEGAVGSSLDEFTKLASTLGASVRVVYQDGEALAVTEDFSPTRVNVAVETQDGVSTVTGIEFIG